MTTRYHQNRKHWGSCSPAHVSLAQKNPIKILKQNTPPNKNKQSYNKYCGSVWGKRSMAEVNVSARSKIKWKGEKILPDYTPSLCISHCPMAISLGEMAWKEGPTLIWILLSFTFSHSGFLVFLETSSTILLQGLCTYSSTFFLESSSPKYPRLALTLPLGLCSNICSTGLSITAVSMWPPNPTPSRYPGFT